MMTHNQERVLHHYDNLAASYGSPESDGFFQHVRQREIDLVMGLIDRAPGPAVLDAGAGPGLYARRIAQSGRRVTAVDLSPRMVAAVRPFVEDARVENVEEMQLGRRFPTILCTGVLEFVEDPVACLTNLGRHLGPRGWLILLFPRRCAGGRIYQLVNAVRGISIRLYSLEEMDALARAAGLRREAAIRPFLHNQVALYRL